MLKIVLPIILTGLILQVGCFGDQPLTTRQSIGGAMPVHMDLWVSKSCAMPGEIVTIRFTLTNGGPNELAIHLENQPVMDIVIRYRTQSGSVDTRWSSGEPLTDDLKQLVLEPGQSKTISMEWKVDPETSGPGVNIDMFFSYNDNPPGGSSAGVLLHLGSCPGPLGP